MRSRTVQTVLWLLLYLSQPEDPLRASRDAAPVSPGGPAAGQGDTTMAIDVEVLVYSGRPNPRARLRADAPAELTRRLERLPPFEGALPAEAGLGYTGLRV